MGHNMGFYLPSRQKGDLNPVITPREYVLLLGDAIEQVVQAPVRSRNSYKRGVADLAAGRARSAVDAFDRFVHRNPKDPVGHRMLGLAHLAAGHFKPGFLHLALALKILRRDVGLPLPLAESLRLELEAGLIRLLLLPLCMRLGLRASVNRLLSEGLVL
jgi:hypothetical protein